MNTTVLEAKLKRHKISYSNENGKIVIGKPKTDLATIIGLIILPIAAGIGICLMIILNNIDFSGANSGRIIAGIIFFFGTGFFYFSRLRSKKQANDNLKTLDHKVIKVKNEFGEFTFDSTNIENFEFSVEQIDEETFEGNLYLVDHEQRRHQILGFDDETEQYVLNDLKWFSEFFMTHVGLPLS